ncbi:hypothetical protein TPHA_0G03640 [Tetrapisispora phaffii CBS 4417]|uniref:A to I editase domain-containing protein n=1 Tax=Tetrapisispora phaffii (strain ATCC 24235 / CBS 4417 / NBRC 1672 / NRRL Y-8282 / UCD 70-5) TaxID=1071381 RepID=G8BWC6_TETPH|nr:hypothetical protein TPHA_0G03640 [Tetrapisispora phaffii CBS 4417]CCE64204.1 hypothetical protein TPHA_0G03640 [Tetrapisispora phaffii CBS 4417]
MADNASQISRISDNYIAEKVSATVHGEYSKLRPSSKPVIKSNSVPEWTVLAGIIAINNETGEFETIAITTGVKATPDADLDRSQGKIIHDCHAEILALRCFNIFLLDTINRISNHDGTSKFVQVTKTNSYEWNKKWDLALYISKLPCGDASMDDLMKVGDTAEFEITDDNPLQYIDPKNKTTIRGRLNYKKRDVIRTKPGRYDSKITLSKSCTDKLCMKQVMGILDSTCSLLMKDPIFLQYIIIPRISGKESILKHAFIDRLRGGNFPVQEFKFISCENHFIDDNHDTTIVREPALVNSIKIFMDNNRVMEQSIINGVKNGFYSKPKKPLRKNCEPIISRYSKWNLLKQIEFNRAELLNVSYLEFKSTLTKRMTLQQEVRSLLSPDGWITTKKDDC